MLIKLTIKQNKVNKKLLKIWLRFLCGSLSHFSPLVFHTTATSALRAHLSYVRLWIGFFMVALTKVIIISFRKSYSQNIFIFTDAWMSYIIPDNRPQQTRQWISILVSIFRFSNPDQCLNSSNKTVCLSDRYNILLDYKK